jgi:hypothetical protein
VLCLVDVRACVMAAGYHPRKRGTPPLNVWYNRP